MGEIMDDATLTELERRWQERMKARQEAEEKAALEDAEKLIRQANSQRTGRRETKP